MDLTLQRRPPSAAALAFAADVGDAQAGPVSCVGARSRWDVGGTVDAGAREVRPPAGILEYEPAEMTVRCLAGTPVAELQAALGEAGQFSALPPGGTVGGALAVGRSGIRRLGDGPLRDVLLEARYVSAGGIVVKAGGPVVKNVSGFDLCRLLVGSLGTLGFLAEVVLRCKPLPQTSAWFAGDGDPFALGARLYRATSLLWDGTTTWVLLEGHAEDVAAQARDVLGDGFRAVEGPPPLPPGPRASMRPSALRGLTGSGWVAEVGVGVVHGLPAAATAVDPVAAEIGTRLKRSFDPSGRLNPGRIVG